jgi:hypothetical protein
MVLFPMSKSIFGRPHRPFMSGELRNKFATALCELRVHLSLGHPFIQSLIDQLCNDQKLMRADFKDAVLFDMLVASAKSCIGSGIYAPWPNCK